MHIAIEKGNVQIVQMLLTKPGIEVNAISIYKINNLNRIFSNCFKSNSHSYLKIKFYNFYQMLFQPLLNKYRFTSILFQFVQINIYFNGI